MAKVPDVVIGPPVIDKNEGTVASTEVTVPPGLLELIVWFGQAPVMLMLVPATSAGVTVPVPPLAIGSVPVTWLAKSTPVSAPPSVRLPLDVTVPDRLMPLTVPVPETLVTVPTNWSLDVMVKLGYVPEMLVVPAPVNDTIWSGAVLVIVKLGYVPDVLMPVPAVSTTVWSGAVLVNVTAPVPDDTEMPVLAIALVTPVLAIVIDPAPLVTLIAVPAVKFAFSHTPATAS